MKIANGPITAQNGVNRSRAERSVHHTRASLTISEPERPCARTWLRTATFAFPGSANAA